MTVQRAQSKSLLSMLWIVLGFVCFSSCSSTTVQKPKPPLPEPPRFLRVPHPNAFTQTEILGLFEQNPGGRFSPSLGEMKGCDAKHRELLEKTDSLSERKKGAREFVSGDPVFFHWCFYAQLIELENGLSQDDFIRDRQKKVIEAYQFLSPIAHAFNDVYGDTRYLRWAIYKYRRLSERVFYRKLEMTPEMTAKMMIYTRKSYAMWRHPEPASRPILEKYGIVEPFVKSEPAPAPVEVVDPPAAYEVREPAAKVEPPPVEEPEVDLDDLKFKDGFEGDILDFDDEIPADLIESATPKATPEVAAEKVAVPDIPTADPPVVNEGDDLSELLD